MVVAQISPAAEHTSDSIIRAQGGDPVAFRDLVQAHERAIFNLALGIVRNAEDAADVVQDVWVRVARSLPQLRDPERFSPWLHRIARNCSMDFYKDRKGQPQPDRGRDRDTEDPSLEVPDSADYAPEEQLLSLDERRKVWEALGALSETDRTILYLRETRELPYAELAKILGISRNAAEVRFFRARERFRRQFLRIDASTTSCLVGPLQLAALVGGQLGDASRRMLERHVECCEYCSTRRETMDRGHRLYQGLAALMVPPATTDALFAQAPHFSSISAIAAAATTFVLHLAGYVAVKATTTLVAVTAIVSGVGSGPQAADGSGHVAEAVSQPVRVESRLDAGGHLVAPSALLPIELVVNAPAPHEPRAL